MPSIRLAITVRLLQDERSWTHEEAFYGPNCALIISPLIAEDVYHFIRNSEGSSILKIYILWICKTERIAWGGKNSPVLTSVTVHDHFFGISKQLV